MNIYAAVGIMRRRYMYAVRRVIAKTLLRTSRRHVLFKRQYIHNMYLAFEMRKNEAYEM